MEKLNWRKSSFSGAGGNCVEAAIDEATKVIYVRNSNRPWDSIIEFTADEWIAFLQGTHEGEFDFGLVS